MRRFFRGGGDDSKGADLQSDDLRDTPRLPFAEALKIRILGAALRAAVASVLAILFSTVLASPFTATISSMFSSSAKGDFRLTDLYTQVADSRPVRTLHPDIVLVDIGIHSREEIAEGLQIISLCEPKAIGLDVNFAVPKENDSILLEVLQTTPNLVLPLTVKEDASGRFLLDERPFFYPGLKGPHYGVVNLPSEREGATIREGALKFPLSGDRDSLPSFVMAMLIQGEPAKAAPLLKKEAATEVINYASQEFTVIPLADLEERAEELTGRYVIVGSMIDAADVHPIPIGPDHSGMEIHAYWLSTLLGEHFFALMPGWIDYALAFLLSFIILFIAQVMTGKMKGITIRLIQSGLLFLIVWIGYALYIDKMWICDLSLTVLILVFSLFALDVVNGIEGAVILIAKKISKHRQ